MGRPSTARPSRRQRPLAAAWCFILVAIGWTWGFGFWAAALDAAAGHPLHLTALAGPVVALAVALWSGTSGPYRRRFVRRMIDIRRLSLASWLAVVLIGAGPALVATGVAALGSEDAGVASTFANGGLLGMVAFALAAGLAEEPGWRGLAVDSMTDRTLIRAAVVLGILWSGWHLPLYFIDDTYQHGLGAGTPEFWQSMGVRVPLAVLLIWLVRQTDGAIVAAVCAHALSNAMGESLEPASGATTWELAVTTAAALLVMARWRQQVRQRG